MDEGAVRVHVERGPERLTMRNWGRVNLIVIAALLLFVMGATMCPA